MSPEQCPIESGCTEEIPKELFGYTILKILGVGAGSVIYAARHPILLQVYALKHVVCKTSKDERFVLQLQKEYEVGRQANHLFLRRSVELKVHRNWIRTITEAALLLELVDGIPLDQHPSLPLPNLLKCFIQTAEALHALHRQGYVHCDLKPNNILIADGCHAKVIDLGQACRIGTQKERIQGTPDFIAPEQVCRLPVTPRTDVFNFGATAYWATCGQHVPTLYTCKRNNSILSDATITPPHSIKSDIPETLSNLIMECIQTNPAKRPQDMGVLAHRLNTILYTLERHPNCVASAKAKLPT